MIYVALLRGINVGGKFKVEMPRLKSVFESVGCQNVLTYINSGNVVFRDNRDASVLVPLIERAIQAEFTFAVRIVLRDKANIDRLCTEIPAQWTNDQQHRTEVMFLWDEIANEDIVDKVAINPDIENICYIDRALVWNIERQYVRRGAIVKLIKTDLYQYMTIRNINTVRKLASLMAALK